MTGVNTGNEKYDDYDHAESFRLLMFSPWKRDRFRNGMTYGKFSLFTRNILEEYPYIKVYSEHLSGQTSVRTIHVNITN